MTSLLLQRSRGLRPPCVLDSVPPALGRSGGLRWPLSVLGKHVAAVGAQSRTAPQPRGLGELPGACGVGPEPGLSEQGRLRAVHSGRLATGRTGLTTAPPGLVEPKLPSWLQGPPLTALETRPRAGAHRPHACPRPRSRCLVQQQQLCGSRPRPGSDFILGLCPTLPGSLSGRPWAVGPSHPHSRSLKAGLRALWEWRGRRAPPRGRGVDGGLKPAVLGEAQACCSPKSGQEDQAAHAPQRHPLPEPLLRNLPRSRQSVVPQGGPGACLLPHSFTP